MGLWPSVLDTGVAAAAQQKEGRRNEGTAREMSRPKEPNDEVLFAAVLPSAAAAAEALPLLLRLPPLQALRLAEPRGAAAFGDGDPWRFRGGDGAVACERSFRAHFFRSASYLTIASLSASLSRKNAARARRQRPTSLVGGKARAGGWAVGSQHWRDISMGPPARPAAGEEGLLTVLIPALRSKGFPAEAASPSSLSFATLRRPPSAKAEGDSALPIRS